ncbi:MAG: threonine aldolase [Rhodobacterales bacterium RIFCSPHIGHO2_02_FULL_62_130]|nr:MAG: threonine aldolase [Rhodobacterales bacterium RIFCSPHIGHO2_02_FULL_62_130]OHC59861.1 MAG: threonine aldolase [Rhodobacterales bacterium RIFCSPHIGHO2_12_FULL_62_75]HCZ00285.1 low specificity L-threonine aldolase [Rhodobacter sp.]
MYFTSDNASGAAPEIMAALARANDGYARSYGADAIMDRLHDQIRATFQAPEAAVYLVATGTVANSLALSLYAQPWSAVFAHSDAHIAQDECGAPEFYTNGAKLIGVAGDHGRMTPDTLGQALARTGTGGVHGVQRGVVSITNVTEAGTTYTPAEIAALTALAKSYNLPSHLDGARFANACVATGATAAEMTWQAGIDIVSFGGTKNGCLGVEAVVIFDPAKAWEFELRRKRGGHLFSKHRYLSAQMEAYLTDDLWLRLATHANAMGARLAKGIAALPDMHLQHPAPANMLFPEWPAGTHARLDSAGAAYYQMPAPQGREAARLVTSWSTTEADVDAFLNALRA